MIRKPDISIQTGQKRQVESTDKPVHMPNYLLNQVQKEVGVWKHRDDQGYLFPDRNNHVGFTIPKEGRAIDTTISDFVEQEEQTHYYNSCRRKTIAIGINDDKTYYFAGIIKINVKGRFLRLKIYRGEVQDDGVTIVWSGPSYHSMARVLKTYGNDQYLEYSMVMSADYSKLYVAVVLRNGEVAPTIHSILRLIELTNLYNEDWDGSGDHPRWDIRDRDGSDVIELNGLTEFLTHNVDIEIDNSGDLHIIAGFQDTDVAPEFFTKYIIYDPNANTWSDFTNIDAGGENMYGAVLHIDPVVPDEADEQLLYIGYLKRTSAGVNSINYKVWMISESPGLEVLIDSYEIYSGENPNEFWDYGPSICVDSDGTFISGYRAGGSNQVYAKAGSNHRVRMVSKLGFRSRVVFSLTPNSLWDIFVKDGLIVGYYLYDYGDIHPIPGFRYSLRRVAAVYDSDDADYIDGEFFEWEQVELSEDKQFQITVYRTYEANVRKLLSYVEYSTWSSDLLRGGRRTFERHGFNLMRQDRNDTAIKSVFSYPSKDFTVQDNEGLQEDDITVSEVSIDLYVIQCESYEDSEASVISYRFYERWRYYWRLLPGQMDEVNNRIVHETIITGKAEFWERYKILRAGCGIEAGNNPIWYGDINRRYYQNLETSRLLERRFTLHAIEPPVVILGAGAGPIVNITRIRRLNFGDAPGAPYTLFYPSGWYTPNGKLNGVPRVTHPYLTIGDLFEDGVLQAPWDNNEPEDKQLYIELYLAFAYRYDNGQVSQYTLLGNIYRLGSEFVAGTQVPLDGSGVIIKLDFRMPRWNHPDVNGNPRITSILCLKGEKVRRGQTAKDVEYKLWKEVLIAKPVAEPFNDEPENGDASWAADPNDSRIMLFTTYLDLSALEKNALLETAIDYTGTGLYINADSKKSYLDGYKRAVVVQDRPFYMGIRLNGEKLPEVFSWAVDAVQAGVRFIVPDIISPSFLYGTKFNIQGGMSYGEDNLVVFGDKDLIWGNVSGTALEWKIRDVPQDIGTNAPDTISLIAEGKSNSQELGIFFLAGESGGRMFNLYSALVATEDIQNDFVAGFYDGGRDTVTYKGIKSLSASNAMAIHLQKHRIFLLHFPDDGITMVRDFNAEDNSGERYQWVEWRFGKNPVAWALGMDESLIMTDGLNMFRFPDTTNDKLDIDEPIVLRGRVSDIKISDFSIANIQRIFCDYLVAGSTLTLRIIRDDGNRDNIDIIVPASTVRTDYTRRAGWQKTINSKVSIEWFLTTPENCTDFELHKIAIKFEEYNNE